MDSKKNKYAMYRGNIKVEILGKKSKWCGVKLTKIKFNNGIIYDCPLHELSEIKTNEPGNKGKD